MQQNLVIVESPAKAKTIEKFLGKDYKVMSSYGHIRDLKKREISVDLKSLQPEYEIPEDKKRIVNELKSQAVKADKVWLASDEDREGEAISWHLCEVLGLDQDKTNRIVFHEITPNAILEAIEHPRRLDMSLVDAQQARRVLDRIVGFKLSPVLWRKVKPSLSAGRVQSVAVRLIVEREREIQNFKSESYFRVSALFGTQDAEGNDVQVKADLARHLKNEDEVKAFLDKCTGATFAIEEIQKKPLKRSPAPPFTTSTLQQEASRKLGLSVSQTMMIAQRLYEGGRITYMRTDSVNLSSLCINSSKEVISHQWGPEYSKPRQYRTAAKGAQEAHEAIRPTYMDKTEIEGTAQERRLYDLIWKRTAASQMADAQMEKTTFVISVSTSDEKFVANGQVVKFDGFLKVYRESTDDDDQNEYSQQLPAMNEGQNLLNAGITATERFTQGPSRYTEATLVHKMEELGIGRPSTYAPTISTIQQREYVQKGDRKGEERRFVVYHLDAEGNSERLQRREITGSDKGKLLPTDIGSVVNDFLLQYFPSIMDYNFTAKVEQQFDQIAEGKSKWMDMLKEFYGDFEPVVEKTMNIRAEHKAGERELGTDPKSGKPVFVKIGRYGPVVQIGTADDSEKPRFAQLPKEKSMETISLEEAIALFRLPRNLGLFEGKTVTIGTGRFGAYILHNRKYTSLPKGENPMEISLQKAIQLIEERRKEETQRHLKAFEEDATLEVMNGRYGPYISYDGKNYRLPRNLHDKAAELTYAECMEIVEQGQKQAAARQQQQQ